MLLVSIVSLLSSVVILFILMVRNGMFNLQKVWGLVVAGSRLARIYFLTIVGTFLLAVSSVILLRIGV